MNSETIDLAATDPHFKKGPDFHDTYVVNRKSWFYAR